MKHKSRSLVLTASATALGLLAWVGLAQVPGIGFGGRGEKVDLPIARVFNVPAADARARAIITAANAFLQSLTSQQRAAAVFAFDDNAQRGRWSNLPLGIVDRLGVKRGDLTPAQNAALDRLLGQVLSADGLRNAHLQMAADDALIQGGAGRPNFGSAFYYVSFLGQPRADKPWMLQFGGHHLAYNVTFIGPQATFSPMLTGGQPLTVTYGGQKTYITRNEVEASRALLVSLDPAQKSAAVRGAQSIQLLLGPGAHGTTVAPEGVRGSALTNKQKSLLIAVVEARVGQFNPRDAAAKIAAIRASINDTYFAWWGPEEPFGAAYFRVTGPDIVQEYSPQRMGNGDPTEHAHNMYREPGNDYGAEWIKAR